MTKKIMLAALVLLIAILVVPGAWGFGQRVEGGADVGKKTYQYCWSTQRATDCKLVTVRDR